MGFPRRRALLSLAACAAGTLFPPLVRAAPLLPAPKGRRAVVIGGGWGGLAAARHLRELAPDIEVILIERNAAFHSLPLSNRWLADRVDGKLLQGDYRRASAQFGYTFLQAAVTAIDRDRRQVVTAQGVLDYDWLILAAGIREDHGAWFGDDARAAAHAREQFGSAWQPGTVAALKARLARFAGGTLGMGEVARATPDGYTLALSAISPLTLSPHLMKLPYDPASAIAAVAPMMYSPVYVLATPAFSGKSWEDLIAQAADFGWTAWLLVLATVMANLRLKLHPLWFIAAGAALGLAGLV